MVLVGWCFFVEKILLKMGFTQTKQHHIQFAFPLQYFLVCVLLCLHICYICVVFIEPRVKDGIYTKKKFLHFKAT